MTAELAAIITDLEALRLAIIALRRDHDRAITRRHQRCMALALFTFSADGNRPGLMAVVNSAAKPVSRK